MITQPLPRSVCRVLGNVFGRIPLGRRTGVGLLVLGTLLSLAAGLAPATPQASKLSVPPRGFNRSGAADLAVGAPYENVGSYVDAGAVNILYGSKPTGISTTANQYWNQNESGILDAVENNDRFGDTLAFGDFDGDGYFDLAIGLPMEDVGTDADAGAVAVLYGSPSGLSSARNQFWTQDSTGVWGGAEIGDEFGYALAAGDFNHDGCDDLAIGVPYEDIGATNDGAVNILYGAPSGLMASNQGFYQGYSDVIGTPANNDFFGMALAAGDFNRDGRDDLAIGIPYKDDLATDNGAAVVLYGSSTGLRGLGSTYWSQATSSVEGIPENGDLFAYALATGDFDGDTYDDLAIGVPGEDQDAVTLETGAVNVLYGSATGINAAGDQIWSQSNPGLPGAAVAGDRFGWALATGDFDKDGYDDLAIGIPWKDDGATDNGGALILYGTSSALSSTGSTFWSQATPLVEGVGQDLDRFGYAVAAADFDSDGYDDLAIGVPWDDLDASTLDSGAVNVLYGSATGINATGDQIWTQHSTGMVGTTAEPGDNFGHALAAPGALPPNTYLPMLRR